MAGQPLETAKDIAARGLSFRICERRRVFPPRDIANAFFACGRDDLIGEELLEWEPFSLSERDHAALFEWWRRPFLGARIDRLGVADADYSRWFTRAVLRRNRRRTVIITCFVILLTLGGIASAWPWLWTPMTQFASVDAILTREEVQNRNNVDIVHRTWRRKQRHQSAGEWFMFISGLAVAGAATVAWYNFERRNAENA